MLIIIIVCSFSLHHVLLLEVYNTFHTYSSKCIPCRLRDQALEKKPNPLDDDVTGRVIVYFRGLQNETVDTKSTRHDNKERVRPFLQSLCVIPLAMGAGSRNLQVVSGFVDILTPPWLICFEV